MSVEDWDVVMSTVRWISQASLYLMGMLVTWMSISLMMFAYERERENGGGGEVSAGFDLWYE
tara:strand:+ start:9183 stop:9368 length:186 start_codon:yes stop_codon:yes gene_type:complete